MTWMICTGRKDGRKKIRTRADRKLRRGGKNWVFECTGFNVWLIAIPSAHVMSNATSNLFQAVQFTLKLSHLLERKQIHDFKYWQKWHLNTDKNDIFQMWCTDRTEHCCILSKHTKIPLQTHSEVKGGSSLCSLLDWEQSAGCWLPGCGSAGCFVGSAEALFDEWGSAVGLL